MSVILKALKKLEEENARPSGGAFSDAGAHPARHGWRKMAFPVLVGFILCGGIVAGALIFSRQPLDPGPGDPGIKSKATVPLIKKAEETAPRYRNPVPKVSVPNHAVSEVATQPASKIPLPDDENGFREIPADVTEADPAEDPFSPLMYAPVMPVPGEKDLTQLPVLEKKEPAIPSEKGVAGGDFTISARNGAATIPEPAASNAAFRISVIEDPGLSLQAISWSADPEKRLAIINGKICREKEHVGGYVIDAINTGDVVVSKGGKAGKLVFKIR